MCTWTARLGGHGHARRHTTSFRLEHVFAKSDESDESDVEGHVFHEGVCLQAHAVTHHICKVARLEGLMAQQSQSPGDDFQKEMDHLASIREVV